MTRRRLGRLLSARAVLVTSVLALSVATLSAAALAVPSAATGPTAGADPAPALEVGKPAWVSVSVATVWRSTTSPRAVDAPALAAPVRIREWLADMTTDERRALNGRADTQAMLGDKVRVLELGTTWARVRVPDQPVPDTEGGYRGWVPRRQLTARPPATADQVVTVTDPTSWLLDPGTGENVLLVSFGTRLPYLGEQEDGNALVVTPLGRRLVAQAGAVSVHDPGRPALPATRRDLVRTAEQFKGLDYLWAGRSGFGFDCSGLTSLDYRVHGIVIPRDARPESAAGTAVSSGDLARGDLLFYATNGVVHHVSMYVGHGQMVHSPGTGQTVQVIATSTPGYAEEYAGARRFLD